MRRQLQGWYRFIPICLGICFVLEAGVERPPAAAQQILDGIAAVVNDDIITIGEVREAMAFEAEQLRQRYRGEVLQEKIRELYKNTLQPLIDLQLQLERAKKLNLQASEEDVNFHMERLKEDNRLSDAQLQEMLESRGMTMALYRKQIRESLLVSKVVNAEVRSRLIILETELQEAYEQRQSEYRVAGELTVSHILFLVPEGATPKQEESAKAKAADVLQQLRSGGEFVALARQYSEGPSAERDGFLGPFRTGQLLPELEAAVASLQPGEISDLVRTRVGWHIVRLEANKAGGHRPFEEVREELRSELSRTKTEQKYMEWLESLRQQSYTTILYEG
ncbi:MAG: peptidylprolyl isomerase [Candidatus Tectomicrobia bacterium]|nr:peptidylprolyl isomerase [Candidatus Tectomicrobia bacterium]